MIINQLQMAAVSYITGVVCAVMYYIMWRIRRWLKTGVVFHFLSDFIFWEATAVIYVYIIYRINEGCIRGFALTCLFAGILTVVYISRRGLAAG